MSEIFRKVLVGAATGALAAMVVDARGFLAAREKDRKATFDVGLAAGRAVTGLLTGGLAALGMEGV